MKTLNLQLTGGEALSLGSLAKTPVPSAPTPLAAQPTPQAVAKPLIDDAAMPVISDVLPVSTPHPVQAPSTVTAPGNHLTPPSIEWAG